MTDEVQKHRVCLLGDNDVGKTALVNQFLSSEYMNTYDASLGKCKVYFFIYSTLDTISMFLAYFEIGIIRC